MTKRKPLTPAERALLGPRQLKEPGSPEWCWQTISFLKDCLRHVDEQCRQTESVLAELVEVQAWRVVPPGDPHGTLDDLLRAEIGIDAETLRGLFETIRLAAGRGDHRQAAS